MTILLDPSVLIALNVGDHVHHEDAVRWFQATDESFATCPITQGALVRHLMRADWVADDARRLVRLVAESERHEFWPDDIGYQSVRFDGVIGHRQVTDAYLAALGRRRKARVATFDAGFADLHGDVADLVPMGG